MCAIDITAEQRKTVLALLARHLPNTTAWVYGSRVKWTSRPESDLDLVVFAKPEQERRVSDLREAFEESNLPFRVDLFVWDDVPEQFRKTIEAEHVVLVEREEQRVAGNTATLRSLLIHTRDGEWGSANPGDGLVPIRVIRGTDFERVRQGDLTTVPIRYLRVEQSARKALRPGDILIETAGGSKGRPTGRTLLIQPRILEGSEIPFTCASFARFLRVDEARVNAPYLYWFLQHLYQIGEMERHQVQHTGIARFQFTRFSEQIQVPVPSRPEQRSIAHILGTLDDKFELNRRMNQTLEAMARALFKSWFVDFDPVRAKSTLKQHDTCATPPQGGSDWSVERARAYLDRMDPNIAALFPDSFVDSELGPIPEAWEVKPMGKLCNKPQYGYTASAKNEAVGSKFLRITDINKKAWIEWESIPYCEITGQDFDKYRLYEGDILIARMADPGHGCMIEEKQQAVFASYLIRFRPLQKRYARLLQYWLRSDAYWELVRERGGGTTRVSLNAKVLSEFSLTVPTCHLIDAFAKQVDSLRVGVVANSIESRALTALRDTLLPKLLSGKVRVSGGTENSGR